MSLLFALLFSAIGLLTTAEGTRAIHQADYQRCLKNIARLEIATGIVKPPPALRGSEASLSRTVERWRASTAKAAENYTSGVQTRRERDILARAHNGQGATPAELAYLSECAAKRYLARGSR